MTKHAVTVEGLEQAIKDRIPNVTVVGGGYVGLPLALHMTAENHKVCIFDTDYRKVEAIERGESYIGDVDTRDLRYFADTAKLLRASSNPEEKPVFRDADVIVVCVPTPLQNTREPDISHVMSALETIKRYARPPFLLALESTVSPGFTREVVEPMFAGEPVFVSFSPERVDPGNATWAVKNTPKVVGANGKQALAMAETFYGSFIDTVVPVHSTDVAEMTKLLENIFRSVNIALVNEMAIACRELSVNVRDVVVAASTKPYGFMRFDPGPGVGGECIGPDPHYLTSRLHGIRKHARLIELASEINEGMPHYVVSRLAEELNECGCPLQGTTVLVVGLAYKPNVSDTRESPALEIITELDRRGALVSYLDPHVPRLERPRRSDGNTCVQFTLDQTECPDDEWIADAAIIVTDHTNIDYSQLARQVGLILDTRGVMRRVEGEHKAKVVEL